MHGEIDYDVCLSAKVVTLEEVIGLQSVDDNGQFTHMLLQILLVKMYLKLINRSLTILNIDSY